MLQMNSIIIIILCVIVVTLQQQFKCPIGHLSFDGTKCIWGQIPSLIDKSYFDAERDCKAKAQNVGIANDRAFLVSIPNAFANSDTIGIANDDVDCSEYFIGLNNIADELQWTDQTIFNYHNWNWNLGCPTVSINGSERCVTIGSNGKWCNRNCQLRYCYICEIILSNSTTTTTTTALTAKTTTTTNTIIPSTMTDCYDWLLNGATSSGIYQINPGYGLAPFNVYCDMTTDGGGWTVIQRRVDASLEFYSNTWQQYKNGFNNGLNRNLWLGNDRIHVMSLMNVTLRVEINGDRNHNNPNIYLYGKYNFSISDEMNNYTLFISLPIEGNASDANPNTGFIYNNRMPFSTADKESNYHGSYCAASTDSQYGGWWFNSSCTYVSLNGQYNPTEKYYGFRWYSQATGIILPIRSEMKIRRQ